MPSLTKSLDRTSFGFTARASPYGCLSEDARSNAFIYATIAWRTCLHHISGIFQERSIAQKSGGTCGSYSLPVGLGLKTLIVRLLQSVFSSCAMSPAIAKRPALSALPKSSTNQWIQRRIRAMTSTSIHAEIMRCIILCVLD